MAFRLSRYFPRGGTLKAVHLQGSRHLLGSNGQPEDPELNHRAPRRNLRAAAEASGIPKCPMHIDDLDPVHFDFRAEYGEEPEGISFNDFMIAMETSINGPDNFD